MCEAICAGVLVLIAVFVLGYWGGYRARDSFFQIQHGHKTADSVFSQEQYVPNQDAVLSGLEALESNREQLGRMTDRFPVICMIDGRKKIFKSKENIDSAIEELHLILNSKGDQR